MRRIIRENAKRYNSNPGAILHTDETITDVIDRITKVPEINPTVCLTEAIVTGYGIINKGYLVDAFLDTYPGNNILAGTSWVKK